MAADIVATDPSAPVYPSEDFRLRAIEHLGVGGRLIRCPLLSSLVVDAVLLQPSSYVEWEVLLCRSVEPGFVLPIHWT